MKQVLGSEVPVDDPGFRHGVGVFETVKVKGGRAILADWHWEALCAAAGVLGLEEPIGFPLDLPPGEEGIWRWFHTGSGIRATWEEGLAPLPSSLSLAISAVRISSQAWSSRFKTLSYLTNVQARKECRADEALLLNEKGVVASASMGNIFWTWGGVIFTPAKECGCRAGTVRRWVIEQGGFELREVQGSPEDLAGAEEIFITNSRIEIMPVHEFEGRPFIPGPIAAALQARYSACLQAPEE